MRRERANITIVVGQRREAGLDRAVAPDLLQEDDQEEEEDRQAGIHGERLEVPDREVAAPEQAQIQHRVACPALVDQEEGEDEHAADSGDGHLRVVPSEVGLADEGVDRPGKAERAQHRAHEVDSRVGLARQRGHRREDDRQRDRHQRHVDRKDPAPACDLDQLAPDQRPENSRDPAPGGPGSDRRSALLTLEGHDDHRQRARSQQRSEHPLQRAAGDQHLGRGCQRAQQRDHPESADPDREDAPLAEQVAQRSADQDQRAKREQVGVRDPLLGLETAAEVVCNRGQGDVDDRGVEPGHAGSEDRRKKHQALLRVRAGSACRDRRHRKIVLATGPRSGRSGSTRSVYSADGTDLTGFRPMSEGRWLPWATT